MTKARRTILVVDDDPNILTVLEARLKASGYDCRTAPSAERALELMAACPAELVVTDVRMPGMDGEELLREVRARWPRVPVILLTAHGSIEGAVDSVRLGAADYLTKPFDNKVLLGKIADYLPELPEANAADVERARSKLVGGRSPAMARFLRDLATVARSDVDVLVLGATGTGKKLVAEILHDLSPRAQGPWQVVDCGVGQATLLESELFGHRKGAFTDAREHRKGLVEEADGGTLVLDEIGNVSPEMQARLLTFLQERTIRPLGQNREKKISCRVVAATNEDLRALVDQGRFRQDLYYRLKVVELRVPSLAERREDIPLLAEHFLARYAAEQGRPGMRIAPATMGLFLAHDWPGNVRELQYAILGSMVFCPGEELLPEHLQGRLEVAPSGAASAQGAPAALAGEGDLPRTLEEWERLAIATTLEQTGGNRKRAADELGISRRAIQYKIKKYGLE
ncbi:MAG: sigma-54-dependent transcriptional regulator [Desulfovibrionaceae bacterium]